MNGGEIFSNLNWTFEGCSVNGGLEHPFMKSSSEQTFRLVSSTQILSHVYVCLDRVPSRTAAYQDLTTTPCWMRNWWLEVNFCCGLTYIFNTFYFFMFCRFCICCIFHTLQRHLVHVCNPNTKLDNSTCPLYTIQILIYFLIHPWIISNEWKWINKEHLLMGLFAFLSSVMCTLKYRPECTVKCVFSSTNPTIYHLMYIFEGAHIVYQTPQEDAPTICAEPRTIMGKRSNCCWRWKQNNERIANFVPDYDLMWEW